MRWLQIFWTALVASTAVQAISWQAPFRVQNDGKEPDLVDLMIEEARQRDIPLDAEMRPTDAKAKASSFTWSQCGGDEVAVHVESIELSPESPQRGQNLTVHGKATLTSEADFGTYVDVSVRVGFLRIFSQRVDVCEALRENNAEVQCPAQPGHYDVTHTALLPSQIPPAKYNVHVEGRTHDDKPLTCMQFGVSFSMFQQARAWLPCIMMHHGDVHDEHSGNVIRFLLASDLHLGYLERDPVRGSDSFDALREILETANNEAVDFILLGGDLFHENKPSRATMYKTIAMLRQYCLGNKPVEIELLSDPFDTNSKITSFPFVNYEDENFNVSLPVFVIHGNHDDPQGSGSTGPLSALDLLATAGLVNYFGKIELPSDSSAKRKGTQDTLLHVRPVLIRKGETRMALYGIGNIKDERLLYELESNHVCMYRPSENPDEWFNLLAIHQNRSAHTQRGYIPESVFDDNLDLIVWGHEHEQRILPEAVSEKNYYISQPGSSVATSLCQAETVEKRIGIVNVQHKDFKIDSIPLQNVRPLVMDDLSLTDEVRAKGLDTGSRVDITKLLRERIKSLIQQAHQLWEDRMAAVAAEQKRDEPLPLIRLRVAYDTHLPIGNMVRFGNEFVNQVANPKDIIQLQLKRSSKSRASHTSVARLPTDMAPAEKMERVQLPTLVVENMRSQCLDLLDAKQLQQSVMNFVEKDEYVKRTNPVVMLLTCTYSANEGFYKTHYPNSNQI
ncbi:meiotic recombination [Malassezia yamatoensis]|uniref:Phosphatidylglycerol/phosphatidylinositol transfer protein n=1 Tax=Malassezia yamatoensis TaxID=253288 RepID=A0AAJ5YRM4_9BASI|nr:meiotic recombination [Malassezia yamatoensis]